MRKHPDRLRQPSGHAGARRPARPHRPTQRPGAADRADFAWRRHRHHGAHRAQRLTEFARPDCDRRQPRRRQRIDRRGRGVARTARRPDAAGDVGCHHHRQSASVQQAALQRQGLHADHGACAAARRCWW